MKILIILPNWLGDALMTTPAIELLAQKYPLAKFTFIGSFLSIEALKYHPQCEKAIVDETKQAPNRLLATYKLAKSLPLFDFVLTFRNQLHSSLLLRFTDSVISIAKSSWHSKFLLSHTPSISTKQHLVKQYVELAMINEENFNATIPNLKLYIEKETFQKPTLGINAGATYGSAKRWYPERFAEVATRFSHKYDILIFGGPGEVEVCKDIENHLINNDVSNYTNLAGKTDIKELCSKIGGCSLFITNDSGPMHVAAAYQVPTVSIFGPTRDEETSQWQNKKSSIVKLNMDCAPCMKRECPLGHHKCMKDITASQVIEAAILLEN
jgi:heptosyltransferase-2